MRKTEIGRGFGHGDALKLYGTFAEKELISGFLLRVMCVVLFRRKLALFLYRLCLEFSQLVMVIVVAKNRV